jgi:hypothetical protein
MILASVLTFTTKFLPSVCRFLSTSSQSGGSLSLRSCSPCKKLRWFCDRQSVGQFVLVSAPWPDFNFLLFVNDFLSSSCWTPSLKRGRVCNLQCKQSMVESRRIHNHVRVSLSHLRHPQCEGPGSSIHIPQEQGGPVIPPGTGFPFHLLLQLVRLRWKYSNPPPHGSLNTTFLLSHI